MVNKIYESDEWKSLNLDIRADLIPTIEKIRPGALIYIGNTEDGKRDEEQSFCLDYCLAKLDMGYKKDKLDGYVDYYVYQDEQLFNKIQKKEIALGHFLGYPQCCVKKFHNKDSKKRYQYFDDQIELSEVPLSKGIISAREMADSIEKGTFNSEFLYTIHVPCNVDCQDSIDMGKKNKDSLEKNDIEAAKWLRKWSEEVIQEFGREMTDEEFYGLLEKEKRYIKEEADRNS